MLATAAIVPSGRREGNCFGVSVRAGHSAEMRGFTMQINVGSCDDRYNTTYYLLLPFSIAYAVLSCVVLVRNASAVFGALISWTLKLIEFLPITSLF
jgi:hypothetical protein